MNHNYNRLANRMNTDAEMGLQHRSSETAGKETNSALITLTLSRQQSKNPVDFLKIPSCAGIYTNQATKKLTLHLSH